MTHTDPTYGGATPVEPTPTRPADDRSLGQIVSDVATDLSTLIKQEMELAKTEMKEEVAKAGKGAGLLGGAGVAGHLFLILLSFTIVYLLDKWIDLTLAFLIVTVVWGIVAAVLAATGRKELKRTNPQLPKTQQTLKEDAAWAKAQKS